jgi:hypothetical protein
MKIGLTFDSKGRPFVATGRTAEEAIRRARKKQKQDEAAAVALLGQLTRLTPAGMIIALDDARELAARLRLDLVDAARIIAKRCEPRKTPAVPRTCRVCGCTDRRACPEGCYWTGPNLCSACADKEIPCEKK